MIGRDGWLFLGDQHERTLTVDRRPATEADLALGKQIGVATRAWDKYLEGRGVKLFRIMIAPNKGTIYPEHLPNWAKPASPNATDALLAGSERITYIDIREDLIVAKAKQTEALYYKTDSHWNSLGAGVAFHAFARQVGTASPELRWPSEDAYQLNHVARRNGGDLANLLRLAADISDSEPSISMSGLSIETTQTDFETKRILHQGGNPGVGGLSKPLLVKSEGALNINKVLWLRDSFGTALSPFMAATFSEILQVRWAEGLKSPKHFIQLVDKFKPDYVFVTVAERTSRTAAFATAPP
jgi:hypothetical protein